MNFIGGLSHITIVNPFSLELLIQKAYLKEMQGEQQTLPYRFEMANSQAWLNHLQERGFVVVGGIASEDDCKRIVTEMRDCLQKFSPALQDDKSWTLAKNYPFMLHGGMVQYVAHTKFQWELREKAAPVFAQIWNCDVKDLACSFDGFCYMDGRRKYRTQHPLSFVHCDQSPKRDYLWSVQGVLNLCNNGETNGGLILIPETHKTHQEIFKSFGRESIDKDWYKFTDEEKQSEIFSKYIKVCGKAGDLMLWDSRVLHCNTVPKTANLRACTYICQVPKSKVPEKVLKKRATAWPARRCTYRYERLCQLGFGT